MVLIEIFITLVYKGRVGTAKVWERAYWLMAGLLNDNRDECCWFVARQEQKDVTGVKNFFFIITSSGPVSNSQA
jgi:hypothetical protein